MSRKRILLSVVSALLLAQIIGITAQDSSLQGRLLTPGEGCGLAKVANTKIVGGSEAKPGQYPWMALVYYLTDEGKRQAICGGSLITSRHVLTAGHCIFPARIYAKLGEHDLSMTSYGEEHDNEAVRVIRHPKYNKGFEYSNDIAILLLKRDVEFNDHIQPICLPSSKKIQNQTFVGLSPFVAGWGQFRANSGASDVLRHVQIRVFNNQKCKMLYKIKHELVSEKEFGDNALCAGYLDGGKDSWGGDSGGPLMLPILEDGTFHMYQIGIVSYGIGGGRLYAPGVYSRVQYFMDWIQEIVNQK